MFNFISAPDAIQEYDLREAQLFQIIKSGKVLVYDADGTELGIEGFTHAIQNKEYELLKRMRVSFFSRVAPEKIYLSRILRPGHVEDALEDLAQTAKQQAPNHVLQRILFIRSELEKALEEVYPKFFQNYIISKQQPVETSPCVQENIVVNISPSLWAGKSPETVYSEMKNKGFSDEVIAYLLVEKMSTPLTTAGKLLSFEDSDKGIERDPKTYRERVSGMVEKAKKHYSFSFND